jgi:hypothetical protein
VSYNVKPNDGSSQRAGTLTIAGKTYTVTQAGNPCVVSPLSVTVPNPLSLFVKVTVTGGGAGCSSTWVNNVNWIGYAGTFSTPGKTEISFQVYENTTAATRTGTLTVAGKTVTVNQPSGCPTITLNQTNLPAGVVGNAYSQTFTASGGVTPHAFNTIGVNLPQA